MVNACFSRFVFWPLVISYNIKQYSAELILIELMALNLFQLILSHFFDVISSIDCKSEYSNLFSIYRTLNIIEAEIRAKGSFQHTLQIKNTDIDIK